MGGDIEIALCGRSPFRTLCSFPMAQRWECYNCTKTGDTTCEGFGGSDLKDCGDYLNR